MSGRTESRRPKPATRQASNEADYARKWSTPLVERTNGGRVPERDITPSCSHASSTQDARRLKRYSQAEEALATSLQHCNVETSPTELQIRALEQVTSLLSAHAHDAQERAAELRAYLANRELEPTMYEALQRARWMEEKRQLLVDDEAAAAQRQLESLTQSLEERRRSADADLIVKAADPEAKRRANLAKFFQISITRTNLTSSDKTPIFIDNPRRRTIGAVHPLRLRHDSTPIISSFPGHARSISLNGSLQDQATTKDENKRHKAPRPIGVPSPLLFRDNTRNKALGTVDEEYSDGESLTELDMTSSLSTTSSIKYPVTPASAAFFVPPLNSMPNTTSSQGYVTIYDTRPILRSEAEILADLQVVMPEYANHLIAEFDAETQTAFQASLRLPTHDKFTKTRTHGSRTQHHGLGTLFTLPDAISSRIGNSSSPVKEAKPVSRKRSFFSKGAQGEEVSERKIGKRLSALRMGGSRQ